MANTQASYALLAHPDRDGILSAALAVRLIGPAAVYWRANAEKLPWCLTRCREELIRREKWPAERLLIIDVPASRRKGVVRELRIWKTDGTRIWFLDHHPWQRGVFEAVRQFLEQGHFPMAREHEVERACGRIVSRTFGPVPADDEQGQRLLRMIHEPRVMEADRWAAAWYPVIDAAAAVCRDPSPRDTANGEVPLLGFASFGQLIESLASGAEVPTHWEPVRQMQAKRNARSEQVAQCLPIEERNTEGGVSWALFDLRERGDINPVSFSLALRQRPTECHFAITLTGNRIKASRLPRGEQAGLDLRCSVDTASGAMKLRGHVYTTMSPAMPRESNLEQLAILAAEAMAKGKDHVP